MAKDRKQTKSAAGAKPDEPPDALSDAPLDRAEAEPAEPAKAKAKKKPAAVRTEPAAPSDPPKAETEARSEAKSKSKVKAKARKPKKAAADEPLPIAVGEDTSPPDADADPQDAEPAQASLAGVGRRSFPRKRGKNRKNLPIRRQVAALPYRRTERGVEVLVMTSRQTRRFVIPKGWPMKKRHKSEAAAMEAFEEAGVRGTVGRKPIGRYTYWKRLRDTFSLVRVAVFPLEVEELLDEWPEREERMRSWLRPKDAAILVDEPALAEIIRRFG